MSSLEIRIPDIGTDDKVDVVEVLVAAGESVAVDDGLVTLESDKASMDVPSTAAGVVQKVTVKVGDKVGQGDVIAILEVEEDEASARDEEGGQDEKGGQDESESSASEDRKSSPESEPEAENGSDVDNGSESDSESDSDAGSESDSEAASDIDADSEDGSDAGTAAETDSEGGGSDSESESDSEPPADTDSASDSESESETAPSPAGKPSSSADLHAEVLVLGSGPGGYTAAFRAADLGKKVVLVERYPTLGGVCLNVGCIPSKAYLHVARVIEEAADLGEHGVSFGEPKFDLDSLREWKDSVVGRLTSGLATMAKQRQVEVVTGTGSFTGPRALEVDNDGERRTLSFDYAVIAAGSRVIELPSMPSDDPRVMDSTGALELPGVPERLLIVGGGIIGLEMANVYGSLGSQITIVELLDGLIPGCDRDLVKPLERRLKKRYKAKIHLETKVVKIESGEDALVAHLEGKRAPESLEFDRVLVCVGRRPNSDRINLEAAGVSVDERGFIPVDSQLRTDVAHIFAIGDLVPGPMLAHKASHEGKVAAEAIAGLKSHFDARVIPSVAYTDPEIAWVGLTETEAEESGTPYEVGTFPWAASGRAIGMGRTEGLTKLLFDPETDRLIGGGVVGANAGDLISEIALAIEMSCDAADVGLTVHPHPTLSESVAFAAEVYEGTVTDLYLKKRKDPRKPG